MPTDDAARSAVVELQRADLDGLFRHLQSAGYDIVGPKVSQGAVVYGHLSSPCELAAGWATEQTPGRYRLRLDAGAQFPFAAPAMGLKHFLHAADQRLFRAVRENGSFRIVAEETPLRKLAVFGVRACDLAAVQGLDRVLLQDRYRDEHYAARREGMFVVALACTVAADDCFCASMNAGPRPSNGYDVLLTEADGVLIGESGSTAGANALKAVGAAALPKEARKRAKDAAARAGASQTRAILLEGLKEAIYAAFEHPRWEETAARCLQCGNCTQACPTCFCVTVEEASDVSLQEAERWRRWDSCFTQNFSYIHGGSVRLSPKSRYRQWLTHKLAAWQDQFGTPGCVGCGRCITWCPAKIDITEEALALRAAPVTTEGVGK
jgi:sulfhydrogenase subunit beta (sulfur reductase)